MNVTSTGIAVALAVIVAVGFMFFGPAFFTPLALSPDTNTMTLPENEENTQTPPADFPTPTELQISDITVGTGATVEVGDTVTVNYVGALTDGTIFDASEKHGQPFTFTVGVSSVIEGWHQGLVGMKEGGQRVLAIPSDLGYGASGTGPIPPNAALLFQIELLKVEKGS